jgi:hypothetical protein
VKGQRQATRGNCGDPGRKAVHVVQQIHGIYKAAKPNDRQQAERRTRRSRVVEETEDKERGRGQ